MKNTNIFPQGTIRQGGMGVYISTPFLANAVSRLGGHGTVSGVAPERILVRILQRGDVGGHYRRALEHFPFPHIARLVLDEYYVEGGDTKGLPQKSAPMFTVTPSRLLIALSLTANFSFVWLSKEGHDNPVSVNYLEKIALPHVYAVTGAILAGVDFVTMGAGLARDIPEMMRNIIDGKVASYRIPVAGENIRSHTMTFHPEHFFGDKLPSLKLPGFIPIISSNLLAEVFMKKLLKGSVQGFVIEKETAGGHNASPRTRSVDDSGNPCLIYGEKDIVDYRKVVDYGLPVWIGGSCCSPEKIEWALEMGAKGIQAGSIFALSEQSGLEPDLRRRARALAFKSELGIRTDLLVSPTGFPFKVAVLDGTLSEKSVFDSRPRICNQGALASLYEKPDGTIGYRCPAGPVDNYVNKGGKLEDTIGRSCICNGLISATTLGDPEEPPIVTLGEDHSSLKILMKDENDSYSVEDVFRYLRCL